MALCLRGKTRCSICGVVLYDGDDVVLHPHFLPWDHPLLRFSDSSMHRVCYERWPCHEYFETVLLKYRELWDARPTKFRQDIHALKREERDQFFAELEQWAETKRQELKTFVSQLSPPPTTG